MFIKVKRKDKCGVVSHLAEPQERRPHVRRIQQHLPSGLRCHQCQVRDYGASQLQGRRGDGRERRGSEGGVGEREVKARKRRVRVWKIWSNA
jgi:hypothetical protein